MMSINKLLVLLLLMSPALAAVELHINDVRQTRQHASEHGYRYMFKHARQLYESAAGTQASELNKILNDSIINSTQRLHLYQGQHSGDWYLQLQLNNQQRASAWWQVQLEQMQRVLPGMGIERHGLRLFKQDSQITIMGRLRSHLPPSADIDSEAADITLDLSAKQQARIYLSESGMRLTTRLPCENDQQQYIDHAFIKSLPQEMFAWSIVMVNDQTRAYIMQHIRHIQPFLTSLDNKVSFSDVKQALTGYQGELFIGFSNSRDGFDVNLAFNNVPVMDQLMAGYVKGHSGVIQAGEQDYNAMRGEQRWAISSSVRIAEVLSGRRGIHFPQHLPEQIGKSQKLAAAAYANTLALAQKYYERLPALRQYQERVGNQELGMLRESLKEMIPHFRETVMTAAHEGDELNVQASGIGNALVILSGLVLCRQVDNACSDDSRINAVYQEVSNYLKTRHRWPQRIADIKTSPDRYCYLRPAGEQLFIVPVLIENPARHNGRGSHVAFSNGEVRFYNGRAIWNRAVELRGDGGDSHWDDWARFHDEFKQVGGMSDDGGDVQVIFEQLQN